MDYISSGTMSWDNWIEEQIKIGEDTLEKVKYLIERDNLKDKSRKRYLVYKRNYLYYKLRQDGYSLELIGSLFNKHHATIIHGIDTYKAVKRYKDVKHILNEYKQIIK